MAWAWGGLWAASLGTPVKRKATGLARTATDVRSQVSYVAKARNIKIVYTTLVSVVCSYFWLSVVI